MKYMLAALVLTMATQAANAECELAYEGQTNAEGKPDGYGKKIFPSCGEYEGDWEDGLRHGQGTQTLPSGYRYSGGWRKNTKQGQANITWPLLEGMPSRKSYSGNVCRGFFCGEGKLITPDGDTYVGGFDFGKYSRIGKLTRANGDTFEGSFYQGQLQGFGTQKFADGSMFQGEFLGGNRHGPGKLIEADGKVTEGIWRYGESPELLAAKASARRKIELSVLEKTLAESAELRLRACDSFGFQRGTDAHAQCAMQLYINEQNQATSSQASAQQRDQRQANSEQQKRVQEALLASQRQQLARQEAIQEAILKEQERVRRMEQSMKLIELGTGIATGSLGGSSTSNMQSHTYTINGQIINCTTTGSVTNCF